MFFPEKRPILCSESPQSTEEVIIPSMLKLLEGSPVEHNKIPLVQKFYNPVECTEPPEEGPQESVMLPMLCLSERGPVEHNKLPLFQRLCEPVECTEPTNAYVLKDQL